LFKLVTSAALIENAHVPPELIVCTQGGLHRLQEENLMAPQDGVANCNPFSEALGFSRNAAFAQLAHSYLKPEDLDNFADRFGFGSPLPLETRVDFGDFVAEVEPLDFARTATGFEGSTLSPLGAAYIAYVIANQGHAGRLQLLDVNESTQPQPMTEFAAIRPETASTMHRMMELTVRRGTSWRAFHDAHGRPYLSHVSVAGKTGTLGDSEVTVSWFVGFAPSQNPEVAISVLLRNGELWHKKANEVARDWLREYFTQPRSTQPVRSSREKTRPRDVYANASEAHPSR
jgi:cell division protein FtsI/penicillin-binding protein 2